VSVSNVCMRSHSASLGHETKSFDGRSVAVSCVEEMPTGVYAFAICPMWNVSVDA